MNAGSFRCQIIQFWHFSSNVSQLISSIESILLTASFVSHPFQFSASFSIFNNEFSFKIITKRQWSKFQWTFSTFNFHHIPITTFHMLCFVLHCASETDHKKFIFSEEFSYIFCYVPTLHTISLWQFFVMSGIVNQINNVNICLSFFRKRRKIMICFVFFSFRIYLFFILRKLSFIIIFDVCTFSVVDFQGIGLKIVSLLELHGGCTKFEISILSFYEGLFIQSKISEKALFLNIVCYINSL